MSLTYDYCLSTSVPESSAQKLLSSPAATKNHYSKVSTSRKIKNILKPVLRKIFKSKLLKSSTPTIKRNSYISATEKDFEFEWISDNDNNNDNMNNDNLANEELEKRLIEEIQDSSNDTAIFIFNENGKSPHQLEKLNKKNFYIPVHFARTNAGTFFWTTAQKQPIEPYQIEWNFLDRWAQA